MVDYRINLAKTLTSSPEKRLKFYNGMLIYLVTCAAIMVLVAYFSSINIKRFVDLRVERKQIEEASSALTGLDDTAFRRPELVVNEIKSLSDQIASLRNALGQRVHLLPIIHNLVLDLPKGVIFHGIVATDRKMVFDLAMPPPSEDEADPVRKLTRTWENNEFLKNNVESIRPVKGERRTVGGTSIFHYQFECIITK